MRLKGVECYLNDLILVLICSTIFSAVISVQLKCSLSPVSVKIIMTVLCLVNQNLPNVTSTDGSTRLSEISVLILQFKLVCMSFVEETLRRNSLKNPDHTKAHLSTVYTVLIVYIPS